MLVLQKGETRHVPVLSVLFSMYTLEIWGGEINLRVGNPCAHHPLNKSLPLSHTQIQVVVKARSKADVSVAFGALEDLSIITSSRSQHHTHPRPQSAPTTNMELLRACRKATNTPAVVSPKPSNSQQKKDKSSSMTKPDQQNSSTGAKHKLRPQSCMASPTCIS